MGRLILNCDLGEDEPLAQTQQLLSLVDAANIGCGFHAGNADKTRRTIDLALKAGVRIGAHPGLPIEGGRGSALPKPAAFQDLLRMQYDSFQASAHSLGTSAAYIKLHGSLYHAVEADVALAEVFLEFLQAQSPDLAVFALASGSFALAAEAAGLRVYREAFADRAYQLDGSLLPRTENGSVLTAQAALVRFKVWREQGTLPTYCGRRIQLDADTLCVHGDSPDAYNMIRELRQRLKGGEYLAE